MVWTEKADGEAESYVEVSSGSSASSSVFSFIRDEGNFTYRDLCSRLPDFREVIRAERLQLTALLTLQAAKLYADEVLTVFTRAFLNALKVLEGSVTAVGTVTKTVTQEQSDEAETSSALVCAPTFVKGDGTEAVSVLIKAGALIKGNEVETSASLLKTGEINESNDLDVSGSVAKAASKPSAADGALADGALLRAIERPCGSASVEYAEAAVLEAAWPARTDGTNAQDGGGTLASGFGMGGFSQLGFGGTATF